MSIRLTIDIVDRGAQALLRSVDAGVRDRAAINDFAAARLEMLGRGYLQRLAATRHDSANRLGADPTGHWAKAAQGVSSAATSEAVVLTLANAPGIARAFKDVTIRPGPGKKYLTIPVHRDAYGLTAAEFRLRHGGLFPLGSGKGRQRAGVLAMSEDKERKAATAVYLLVPEVHQRQDRTLLPSDEHLLKAYEFGLRDWQAANQS